MPLLLLASVLVLAAPPRARDLGIPLPGSPGDHNAITDVPGVLVGHRTIRKGEGKKGELNTARTGVTVVFPLGRRSLEGVPAAWGTLNGNGEMTGTAWIDEVGLLEGPVALTNTQSVGVVRDAIARWAHTQYPGAELGTLPVVSETDDSWLSDLYGQHVTPGDVILALRSASGGVVAEGCVGAGTGTVAFGFKAGIGTSSRRVGRYLVGVLSQVNFGKRTDLQIRGVPIGRMLDHEAVGIENPLPRRDGSIVVIVATDAPLLPHQLKRLVKRVPLGIGLTGGLGRNTSGDIFIAFSTSRPLRRKDGLLSWVSLQNADMDSLFEGVVQATEESILNALVAAVDTRGINGNHFFAIPKERLRKLFEKPTGFSSRVSLYDAPSSNRTPAPIDNSSSRPKPKSIL